MKTILYPNKNAILLGHNRTNGAVYSKTSKLRTGLHFRYSIVIPTFIPLASTAQCY